MSAGILTTQEHRQHRHSVTQHTQTSTVPSCNNHISRVDAQQRVIFVARSVKCNKFYDAPISFGRWSGVLNNAVCVKPGSFTRWIHCLMTLPNLAGHNVQCAAIEGPTRDSMPCIEPLQNAMSYPRNIYICSRVHPLIGVRAHTPRAHHHSRPIERVNDSDDMPSVSVERRIHFNEIARYLVQCRASTVIDTTSKWYQRYQPEWVSERAKQQTNNFRPRPFSTIYHTKRTRKMPVYGRVGQSHAYAYTLHTHTGAIMAPFILQSMICTQSVMLCLIADTHTHHILTLAAHSVTHTQHTNKVNRDQFYFRLRAMCVHRHWPLSRAKRNSVPFDVPNTHRLNPMKICVHCTIDLW